MSEPTYPSSVTFDSAANVPYVLNSTLTFFYGDPAFTGYSPISSYTLYSLQDPLSPYNFSTPSPYVVSNLTNGLDYTYSIVANNAAGFTSPSTIYQTVEPGFPPNAPINLVVSTITPSTALVTWNTASVNDRSQIKAYLINATPNNLQTHPISGIPVGLQIEPLRTSALIAYSNQPSTLSVQSFTDAGYSVLGYAPFIKNDYILRVDPYMFTQANSTITDVTSTYTFSSIGSGSNIIGQNLFMQFSSGQYLQGPSISSFSSYTIQSWIQLNQPNTNYFGNILGNTNTTILNIPCASNTLILQSSTFSFAQGGQNSSIIGYAGGGGGYGGGSTGGFTTGQSGNSNHYGGAAGGDSYVIPGGTIFNGISSIQGNAGSPKNPLNYGRGGPATGSGTPGGSNGLIVLSFLNRLGETVAPDFGVSTNGVGLITIPTISPSTTNITAYIWGAGGGGGPNTNPGGGGACVVVNFQYVNLFTVGCFVGGGGDAVNGSVTRAPTAGGGGAGSRGAASGGGCSYITNGQVIGMAGGGGGAGWSGIAGGAGQRGGPGTLGGNGGNPGCNGIGGSTINGITGSSIRYTLPGIAFYSTSANWMNFTVTYNRSTFSYFSNASSILNGFYSTIANPLGNAFQFGSNFTGNIGQTLIYSRALSTSEIVSNFQATRYIYGI